MMASKASHKTIKKIATPARKAPGVGIIGGIVPVSREPLERRQRDQELRRALTLISALKSFETGQPVSAAFTAASNFALSAPGMVATTSRWLLVMEKPSPTLSSVIVAGVSSFPAVIPAPPSCAESAMVKHPAWAAASSSSGLVPTPFSKRVLKEYCVFFRTPLSVEIEPLPSFRPPCHTADALRCMMPLLLRCFEGLTDFESREFDSRAREKGILAE